MGKRGNKYGVAAKAERTHDGVLFASKAEMVRWQEHVLFVKAGHFSVVERQPRFTLGCPENVYVADFDVHAVEPEPELGLRWVEDVKGHETSTFKRNVRLWKKYGPCPLVILKRKRRGGWERKVIYPES